METTAAIGVPRIFSGVGGSGRRPVNPPTPEGRAACGAYRKCEYEESAIFEGIRGAGAEGALGLETVHPRVPISSAFRKWKFNDFLKQNIGF